MNAAAADDAGVPLLATLSSTPRSSIAPAACLRDLCGGIVEQSVALLRTAEASSAALLHSDAAVAAAIARCANGIEPVEATTATAAELRARGVGAVLFAGAGDGVRRVFDEMRAMEWWPPLL